jgi:hypothetical protein
MSAPGARTYWWPIGASSLAALQHLDRMSWSGVSAVQMSAPSEPLIVRCGAVLFEGPTLVEVSVIVRDITPGWEVFGLSVEICEQARSLERPVRGRVVELGILSDAFSGHNHHITVVGTEHVVPEWALDLMERLVIEDALMLRDRSGQAAVIRPDPELPGALRITRGNPSSEEEEHMAYRRIV